MPQASACSIPPEQAAGAQGKTPDAPPPSIPSPFHVPSNFFRVPHSGNLIPESCKKLATDRHLLPNKPRMLNLPNAITLTRIALVVVFTAAVSIADQYSWGYLAALVTFILAACTDWLDGYLARRLNQVTTFGKLIDPWRTKLPFPPPSFT